MRHITTTRDNMISPYTDSLSRTHFRLCVCTRAFVQQLPHHLAVTVLARAYQFHGYLHGTGTVSQEVGASTPTQEECWKRMTDVEHPDTTLVRASWTDMV